MWHGLGFWHGILVGFIVSQAWVAIVLGLFKFTKDSDPVKSNAKFRSNRSPQR